MGLLNGPGPLARLAALIAELEANICHVRQDRRTAAIPLGRAEVYLELQTRRPEHIGEILDRLKHEGHAAQVLP